MLNKTPQILYVFLAFVATLISWVITKDAAILPVILTLGGAVGGVAIGDRKAQQVNADEINIKSDKSDL